MIGEIKNNVDQATILPDTKLKAADDFDILNQGFDVFKSLLSSINPFEKSQTAAAKEMVSKLSADNMIDNVADTVVEVSRGVFSEKPQSTLESTFLSEDVSALQNSLANALTSSLMSSLTDAHSAAESAAEKEKSATAVPNAVAQETPWSISESLGNLSFGKQGLGLEEAFSTINPVNNVPILSEIQQKTASNEVKAFSSLAGGYLVGGPLGLAFAAVNVASEEFTGDTILGNMVEFGRGLFNQVSGGIPTLGNGVKTQAPAQQSSSESVKSK